MSAPADVYHPRNPQSSGYYRCVEDYFETFVGIYGACPANPMSCFDRLSTTGKMSVFSMSIPFTVSLSKGKRGFDRQAP
jgi:hypothetical protein